MNANLPTVYRRAFSLALVAILLSGAPLRGQSPTALLRRADELYRADKLLQAEGLYKQALDRTDGSDRRRCFEQLLAIYVRVGRQDQAIQTGGQYERWLRKIGEPARARELALDLGGWQLALGHYADAEPHLRRALDDPKGASLSPARRITALTYLALAAEKQGDRARAAEAWGEVESFARAQLESPRNRGNLPLQIEASRRLADSYRFQGRAKEAIGRLEAILPAFDGLPRPDPTGQCDTLRQLAGHLMAAGRAGDAEKRLRAALELHARHAGDEPLTRADLSCELADALERQGRADKALLLRQQAVKDYRAVLAAAQEGRPATTGALAAFWKLQVLLQRTGQFDRALKLTEEQSDGLAGDLLVARLHAEQGRLQVLLGDYGPSRRLLEAAVHDLEKQSPLNLTELPPALLNLAVAELATGGRTKAQKVAADCLALYRKHHLPDDLVLVETYNLLGTCAAQAGDYAEGIKRFRVAAGLCARLGPSADPPHSNVLLNIALLHKSQGDVEQSLAACKKAREVYKRFANPDSAGFAALDAAAAALLAGRAEVDKAYKLAKEILRRCKRLGIAKGPLVMTARHCEGLYYLFHGKLDEAETSWHEVAELHGRESPLRPRTLNYLALTREIQKRWDDAEALYLEALALQDKNARAYPVVHFTTLWRLANIAKRRGDGGAARKRLEKAIGVVEQARLRTYGDARQRAAFFEQFEPAFEQLVAWCVRDGDVAAAVGAVARGRGRTLLDQLLLANVDPLKALHGPEGEKWAREEQDLRRRITALRGSVQWIPEESLKDKDPRNARARKLLAELEQAQKAYTEVYRDILSANPVYRGLSGQEFTEENLEKLRAEALTGGKLLLVYHVGRQQSHLLLLGERTQEAFALTVPKDVAERAAAPLPPSLAKALARGIVLRGTGRQPARPAAAPSGPAVPLGRAVLRALVENYLEQIHDPEFRPSRGLRLRPKKAAEPLDAQRLELLADAVLPAAARERIQALGPKCVIVVPDGALHKLPFEALVLRSGDKAAYVLDELPPLVYAPSVAILAHLAERARDGFKGPPRSLLTVADPAYPKVEKQVPKQTDAGAAREGPSTPALLGLWGQFERLPQTRVESIAIGKFFDQKKELRGDKATEQALRAELQGKHVVHIAAHGIAFEGLDNNFGALVLTPPPPGKETPGDDGFLYLREIYTLPLQDCQLAVLSACVTNVGPQRPLEGGVTLAGGFLSAGARRVVASHWSVDDRSTAELMTAFFREVRGAGDARAAYAGALQRARRAVRARAEWSAPYHWAPFVLVGPGD